MSLALLLLLACGEPAPDLRAGPGRLVAELQSDEVVESSGLVRSSREGVFWTHNDSGGQPRIYAFDTAGKLVATVDVEGARAIDWEEMAAFDRAGRRWLLIADTGDNRRARTEGVELYLLPEPDLDKHAGKARVARTLNFRYPDGPHDCEAMAVDVETRTILLVTKDREDGTRVYRLPLDADGNNALVAELVTTLELAVESDLSGRRVTAMDLSSNRSKLALLTYTHAWEFRRAEDQDWKAALQGPRRKIALPPLFQREGLTYAADGNSLFVTSEGAPMPLVQVD